MQKKLVRYFLFLGVIFTSITQAQPFTVDTSVTAAQLLAQLAGNGAIVSNANLNCPNGAFAIFSGGASTNLGMPDGILLTSGNASGIGASSNNFNSGYLATPGFPELDAIASATTYDGCMLEFDIIPTCDTINLKYVMGSEEYPEYVGSGFNDAYAFYLNGPKPGGGTYNNQNIGTIPGTNTPITINNVNQNQNTQWYVDNTNGGTIVYDGFTKVLTASLVVVPCQTYHMKIMIADGGDSGFDSGIFLSAKGLTCPNTITLSPDKTICGGESTDLHATGAAVYSWTPSTGLNTTTGPDVIATPSVTTTYTVSYDGGPCAQQLFQTVTVYVNGANVNVSDTSVCFGESVQYNIVGTGNFTWDPPTGLSASNIANPIISPTVTTQYVVTVVQNQCTDSDTLLVTVNPLPIADFTASTECIQTATVFSDQSSVTPGSIATWHWSFGDGTTDNSNTPPSHLFASAGSYNVQLNVTSDMGCKDSLIIPVTVKPKPIPVITTNIVCFGEATIFGNSGANTNESYLWNFGDTISGVSETSTNPTYTYPTYGTFNVSLTASINGCDSTVYAIATVNPKPLADFNTTTECFGIATNITDNSSITNGNINNWNWTLGDGNITTGQTPAPHTYNSAGNYNIELIVTSDNNCTDTLAKTVTVKEQPIALFTVDSVCLNTANTFIDLSYAPSGTIYNWSFGDGTTSTNQNTTNTYSNEGTYTATLTVSLNGCDSSIMANAVVHPNPISNFSATTECFGVATTFTNNSNINTGSITNWNWSLGDGNSSSLPNPGPYSYGAAGTYLVQLITNSNYNCTDTSILTVTVKEQPIASYSVDSVCDGNAITFTDNSFIPYGSSYTLNTGDYNSYSAPNFSHTYSYQGTFQSNLTISLNGCSDSYAIPVNVFPKPIAAFSWNDVCFGNYMNLIDQTQSSIPLQSWKWNVGPITFSTVQNPVHYFPFPADYNVTLISTNVKGCSDTTTNTVSVYHIPQAAFSFKNVCEYEAVNFEDISTVSLGNISQWEWNFGETNGQNASFDQQNATWLYSGPGTYNTQLIVTTENGCTDTVTKTVVVNSVAVPSFTNTNVCFGNPNSFSNNSTNANGCEWNWNFGDNTPNTNNQNEFHTYSQPGKYLVTLTATTDSGCVSIAQNYAEVYSLPQANFIGSNVCLGANTEFSNISIIASGDNESWSWNFGDSTSTGTSAAQNPSYLYATEGTYSVTLTATTNNNCIDTAIRTLIVHDLPKPFFSADDTAGCAQHCVNFKDESLVKGANIIKSEWNYGDGSPSENSTKPYHCYDNAGDYDVILTVTSDKGCTASSVYRDMITVFENPVADFNFNPQEATILEPVVNFNNLSISNDSNLWSFADGTYSNLINPVHNFNNEANATYPVKLVVTSAFGCKDSIIKEVTIGPEFAFFIPNVFTPNGDEDNDFFFGTGLGVVSEEMYIYDRWGNQIFKSTEMNAQWDGKVQQGASGQLAMIDVYVYRFVVRDLTGKKHNLTGHVSLLR